MRLGIGNDECVKPLDDRRCSWKSMGFFDFEILLDNDIFEIYARISMKRRSYLTTKRKEVKQVGYRGYRGRGSGNGQGKRQKAKKKGGLGILRNRRNPGFGWITPYDVWLNLKERAYCWWYRVPQGSFIAWRDGKIKGHSTNAPRPWFKK